MVVFGWYLLIGLIILLIFNGRIRKKQMQAINEVQVATLSGRRVASITFYIAMLVFWPAFVFGLITRKVNNAR